MKKFASILLCGAILVGCGMSNLGKGALIGSGAGAALGAGVGYLIGHDGKGAAIGAAIGIGGAILLGERWAVLDPLASIVVGGMLMKVAWDLLKGSLGELTDQSLSADEEREIEEIITSIDAVSEPHNLRTRRIGNRIAIESHIRMDGDLPLHVAHEHATAIERKLKERFGPETLVTIHMEPKK